MVGDQTVFWRNYNVCVAHCVFHSSVAGMWGTGSGDNLKPASRLQRFKPSETILQGLLDLVG
jgi:hypothetical protein